MNIFLNLFILTAFSLWFMNCIHGLQGSSQKHSIRRQPLVPGGHSCPNQKGRKEGFFCSKKQRPLYNHCFYALYKRNLKLFPVRILWNFSFNKKKKLYVFFCFKMWWLSLTFDRCKRLWLLKPKERKRDVHNNQLKPKAR